MSGDARVYGNARVYGDAQVYGNAWELSPIQIQGSKHFVNECAKGEISIGCQKFPIDEWLRSFESIGDEYGYTPEQIKEYGLYIKLIKDINDLRNA